MNIDQLESQEFLKNTQVKGGVRNPAMLDSEECRLRNPAMLDSEECAGSSEIDKLTLELLLNKTHYQKYLSKTDPQKHAEYCEFLDKLARFREDILQMTTDLLDNPKKMYTNEVGDAFNSYAKALVKYLEIEQANKSDDDDDDDVLFPSGGTKEVKKPQSNFAKPRSAYGTLDQWIPRVKQ